MKAIRKYLESIERSYKRYSRKRSGTKLWKSELKGYDNFKKPRKFPWTDSLSGIKKRIATVRRKQSYLSRSEKKRHYGRRALKICLSVGMVCLLALALVTPLRYMAASLDFFLIRDIEVSGCSVTKPTEIRKMAGIDYNTNMFSISAKQAAAAVAEHPWVEAAEVKKSWPAGVRITVEEQRPIALMVTDISGQGKIVYVNRKGEVIAPAGKGDDLDYPVITVMGSYPEDERQKLLSDAVSFLRLTAANNPNLPAQSVSEIHLDQKEGLIIRLVDFPFPIYFGSGEVGKKYRQLYKVLAVLYKKGKNSVDISGVEYIRMEYLEDKVLVAQSNSG
ncbi:MAG: FtsQ-type POTRA domain-containing protein [Desulfopila sp.]|jgi:cell division septal protein FtsQ|nr:FtsQ-type POTRA domain-containing protein [Desulfopila sp.]